MYCQSLYTYKTPNVKFIILKKYFKLPLKFKCNDFLHGDKNVGLLSCIAFLRRAFLPNCFSVLNYFSRVSSEDSQLMIMTGRYIKDTNLRYSLKTKRVDGEKAFDGVKSVSIIQCSIYVRLLT